MMVITLLWQVLLLMLLIIGIVLVGIAGVLFIGALVMIGWEGLHETHYHDYD